MRRTCPPRLFAAVFLTTLTTFAPAQSTQTRPALDPSRREKAAAWLKLAQDAAAKGDNRLLSSYIRRDMVQAQIAIGDIDGARTTIAAMENESPKIDALLALHAVNAAKATAAKMDRRSAQIGALATIAASQKKSGDTDGAAETLRQARNLTRQDPGELLALAKGQIACADLIAAKETLARMTAASWQKSEVLSLLAEAQARAGDTATARSNFAAARAALAGNADRFAFWSAQDIDATEARSFAATTATSQPTISPIERARQLASTAREQLAAGNHSAALAALAQAKSAWSEAPADPSSTPRRIGVLCFIARTFNDAGDSKSAADSLTVARKVAEALPETSEYRATFLANVAGTQRDVGDIAAYKNTLQAAVTAARRLPNDRGSRVHALWEIAGTVAGAGDASGARDLVTVATAEGRIDPAETSFQAGAVAAGIAHAEGAKADLAWIEKLDTPEEKASAYAAAALGLVEAP